jgi:hypothetical protein
MITLYEKEDVLAFGRVVHFLEQKCQFDIVIKELTYTICSSVWLDKGWLVLDVILFPKEDLDVKNLPHLGTRAACHFTVEETLESLKPLIVNNLDYIGYSPRHNMQEIVNCLLSLKKWKVNSDCGEDAPYDIINICLMPPSPEELDGWNG